MSDSLRMCLIRLFVFSDGFRSIVRASDGGAIFCCYFIGLVMEAWIVAFSVGLLI